MSADPTFQQLNAKVILINSLEAAGELSTIYFPFLQITFYEGKCFTGRKLEVRGDCDNFQDRGFMNR